MSLDAIRKSIVGDAEAKASAIDAEADSEAKRIVHDAEARAKEAIKSAEHEAEAEAERMRKEAVAGAETEANSIMLEAKGEAVERSLSSVASRLEPELARHGMKKILDSSIRQFKQIGVAEAFRIKTSKKNAQLLKGSKFDVEYADVDGFVICSLDGSVALNATVGSIVDRERDDARKLISQEMFGKGHAASVSSLKPATRSTRPADGAGKAKDRKKR